MFSAGTIYIYIYIYICVFQTSSIVLSNGNGGTQCYLLSLLNVTRFNNYFLVLEKLYCYIIKQLCDRQL